MKREAAITAKNKPLTEGKFKKVAAGLFDLARAVEAKHGVTP